MATIETYEMSLVRLAAPDSLTPLDAILQLDLAQADTGVLEMANAQMTGDQVGFDADRRMLQQALPAVDADTADILKSQPTS